ncbi:MAG: asparaginase domain-containing protein [Nanoarchaeota archaeon]
MEVSTRRMSRNGKKRIFIASTGGTYMGVKNGNGEVTHDPNKVIQENADLKRFLEEKVGGIRDLADIDYFVLDNIDSMDMTCDSRAILTRFTFEMLKQYDAGTWIHGSDGLISTSAFMTYGIRNLGKPVTMVAANKPVQQQGVFIPFEDLYCAVRVATADLGEIVIVNNGNILRAVMSEKINDETNPMFASSRVSPLGSVSQDVLCLSQHRIKRRDPPYSNSTLFTDFDPWVLPHAVGPGSKADIRDLERKIHEDYTHAVVMLGRGKANTPEHYGPVIKEATKMGKPVIYLSIISKGNTHLEKYPGGAAAKKAGAKSAEDIVEDTGFQKTMYGLGKIISKAISGEDKYEGVDTRSLQDIPREEVFHIIRQAEPTKVLTHLDHILHTCYRWDITNNIRLVQRGKNRVRDVRY